MKALVLLFPVLLLIGGAMKLARMQLPVLDYSLGGPMPQPYIQVVQPNLNQP